VGQDEYFSYAYRISEALDAHTWVDAMSRCAKAIVLVWAASGPMLVLCPQVGSLRAEVEAAEARVAQQRWAVLVGVSWYRHHPSVPNLRYADADAQAFYDFFTSAAGGFQRDHVLLLKNEQATRRAVLDALSNFVSRAHEDDLVWIHFSTFGSTENTLGSQKTHAMRQPLILLLT